MGMAQLTQAGPSTLLLYSALVASIEDMLAPGGALHAEDWPPSLQRDWPPSLAVWAALASGEGWPALVASYFHARRAADEAAVSAEHIAAAGDRARLLQSLRAPSAAAPSRRPAHDWALERGLPARADLTSLFAEGGDGCCELCLAHRHCRNPGELERQSEKLLAACLSAIAIHERRAACSTYERADNSL